MFCLSKKTVSVICFVIAASLPIGVWAADDDYLGALSEEAGSLEALGNAQRELGGDKASATKKKMGTVPERVASAKGIKQFEGELQRDFPASFILYQQLNGADRKLAFSEYTFGTNVSHDDRIFAAINRIILLQVK
ncbi:MAG: hypothetical protein IME93_01595 [Proteobacteria bacterium]|nr:hypothetical protein [Pseudomonadota bacterium]